MAYVAPNQYVVVMASFFGIFLAGGVTYTTGIFYFEWLNTFGQGAAITSVIPSLNLCLYNLFAAVGSILINRFGFRWVVISAGLISSAGMVTSAFVYDAYLLMFTFGVTTGIGFGICNVAFSLAPAMLFPKRRSLFTGLALSGIGCGTVILPPIIEQTIKEYGNWRAPMLIVGGLTLNIIVCGALLPGCDFKASSTTYKQEQPGVKRNVLHLEMFKSVHYLLFVLHGFLFSTSLSVMYVHIVALLHHQTDVTKFMSGIFMTCFGIARFLGSIGHGLVGQIKCVNIVIQCVIACVICALGEISMPFITNYSAMLAVSCLVAFMFGPYNSIHVPIASDIVGSGRLSQGYGYFCIFCGSAAMVGAPIAGILYSNTGNYSSSFFFSGAVVLSSALVLLPLRRQTSRSKNETKLEKCDEHLLEK